MDACSCRAGKEARGIVSAHRAPGASTGFIILSSTPSNVALRTRVMLANHPGGFFPVCEWYPSVSCQWRAEIYRAVTSRQPAFAKPFAAAPRHSLSLSLPPAHGARQDGRKKRDVRAAAGTVARTNAQRQVTFVSFKKKKHAAIFF